MISGVEITDLTKQHANELIQQANKVKLFQIKYTLKSYP